MWVACKLPNGLNLGEVTLNGAPLRGPTNEKPPWQVFYGFGLTEISDDVWITWLKKHPDSDLLRNRVLFGGSRGEVEAFCVHNSRSKTGLERQQATLQR